MFVVRPFDHDHWRPDMTAVLISSRPALEHRRVSAATYRRRRAAVGGVLVGVIALLGAFVPGPSFGPGGVPASATGAETAFERSTVMARPGDTLWTIARTHRGEISHDVYVDALVRLNGGASIEAGQRIVLP